MSNGHSPDMRRERYKCERCLGREGDEITDPHTQEKYRVLISLALPLKRKVTGSGEWRVEPICEHCAEAIQRAAKAENSVVPLESIGGILEKARRLNRKIIRLHCKTMSIVRGCAESLADTDDCDLDIHAITGTGGGST